ncbi:hypothetical protein BH24ACT9_BH24ACT9_15390 [soil metagenome]
MPTRARSTRRRGLRAGLLLALAVLLSGCLKYDLMLVVTEDDTMDGSLIVAVAREFAAGQDIFGQSGGLTPSQGTIAKEAYEDADYVGSRYIISGVPISEIDVLSSDSSTRFSLTHQGEEYLLDASLDFNLSGTDSVPTDGSFTAMVSITFPGEVLESNGAIEGNSVVWTQLRPDAENSLTARASAVANGQAGSSSESGIAWWIWALCAAALLAAAGIVTWLVLRGRRAAASARAAQAGTAVAPGPEQQGWYDAYGAWIPAPGYGEKSGYSGHDGGYESYHGTYGDPWAGDPVATGPYGDSYAGPSGDTYGGPPGTAPYPQVAPPSAGYSGQTVVSPPGQPALPQPWSPRPPT